MRLAAPGDDPGRPFGIVFAAVVGAAVLIASLVLISGALHLRLPAIEGAPGVIGAAPRDGTAESEVVVVARVVDGDTFALDDGRTIRLLSVDAPETSNPNLARPQPYGVEAARRLASLVAGRAVVLERDETDVDHYGRLLRHVWADERLVSEVLVEEGLARVGCIAPDMRYCDLLRSSEVVAKDKETGLWGQPRPTSLPVFGSP